ncbi:Serine/threonine-protein kinase STY46 [Pelomyxa schiedti]|nr:Serine/threonine-protein kinase STY46 [Pelomyxa schiedti]
MGNIPSDPQLDQQQQYEAMRHVCSCGTMPELPSPTWDINTPIDACSWTMLHFACAYGHESLVGQLLGVGTSRNPPIDPNKTDSYGRTPLCHAAREGNEAVVRMLVPRPDVDVNKGCPLVEACGQKHMRVVVALLECPRVDVNLSMTNGETALHKACEMGLVEGVKVLLKVNGVDTNRKNIQRETPFDVATRCKFTDICNLLKDHNSRIIQSSKLTFPPPQVQPSATTTKAETAPITTTRTTSNVVSKAPEEGCGVICSVKPIVGLPQERNWEITVKQQKREITELNARITQLEDENAKNLKLLHDERKCREVDQQRSRELQHNCLFPLSFTFLPLPLFLILTPVSSMRTYQVKQNSEMELQRLQEKNLMDMTAKNNKLMELEAHITTLEEESAKNLKIFCDERAFLQHYTTHMMSHVEQGEGTWCNILPESNNCKPSQVRIAFEDLPSFDEIVCAFCPLQMVVNLIITRKFGVEPTQQLIFTVCSENNSEELLTDSSRTLDDIQKQQQQGSAVAVSIKVRIKSTTTIQEKDLKFVSQLGVGSYGTVYKCSFLHNTFPSSSSLSSSTSETTTFVAVKALHELIRSDFNVTQFQQEAVVIIDSQTHKNPIQISSSLRHPNIVRCLGTCTTSTGSLLIVSELMEMSLTQLLHHKSLMFTEIVALSSGISKGMAALHLRNYMHRDLTCNNVLIDSHGTPKIADFGVSRALQSSSGGGHRIIAAPPVSFTDKAGTEIYLPPQMHTRHYGLKGDMWEFAVLLSVLLNGTIPEVSPLKSASAVTQFLAVQRTSLSSSEVAELNRLCQSDPGELVVVECLSRRNAIVSSFRSDPKLNNTHSACVGLFSLVVESCLSILESNRPSFPAIERMLMTCASILFEGSTTTTNNEQQQSASTAATAPSTTTTTTSDNRELAARIAGCLEDMAASFPCHLNPSSTTTAAAATSSFLSS